MSKTCTIKLTFILLLQWVTLCSGGSNSLGLTRDPFKETVEYLQAEEYKLHGGIVSVRQTQKLLDTLWESVVCARDSPWSTTRPGTRCQEVSSLFKYLQHYWNERLGCKCLHWTRPCRSSCKCIYIRYKGRLQIDLVKIKSIWIRYCCPKAASSQALTQLWAEEKWCCKKVP